MSLLRHAMRLLLGRRLPVTSGELALDGPEQPITIRRDAHGIPYIDAATDADALFGLGFVHGQDRAGQLEILVRIARGTLAAWVGPGGLPADRMSRRIGFRRSAEAQLGALDADVRAMLEAYVRGLNHGRTVGTPRAYEFAILGGNPTPWDAADVLAFLKLQSFALPSNWDVELARLRMLRADGSEAVKALDPAGVEAAAAGSPVADALGRDLASFQQMVPRGGGSNNWVIAGARTSTGMPILANDPHLGPTLPPPWYLAQIRTPHWAVAGATFAGAPSFPIGHNGFAAWGVTAGLTDNSDLALETITPAMPTRRELIRVKGGADVVEEVVVAPRGPIISPLVPGLTDAISLRAVWLEPLPMRGFIDSPRARSFDDFRRPFAAWPFLPLNLLYADRTGTTGWQLAGQIPIRAVGNGTIPLAESAWSGLVPFEKMPHRANPPEGYYATANQPPEPVTDAFLGVDFVDPYRALQIRAKLAERTGWTVEDCLKLQQNQECRPWQELRPILLSLVPADADAKQALDLLRAWDGALDEDSVGGAVYEFFVIEMSVRAAKAKAPKSWELALGGSGDGPMANNLFGDRRTAHLLKLLREQPPGWFADGWEAEMQSALAAVVQRLTRASGPPAYWAWGHLRTLVLAHPLFGKKWGLRSAFNVGPVPFGGDMNTILQAGVNLLDPATPTHNMPNLRCVFDLADLTRSVFVLAGGQSGNPGSPHFADLFPLWRRGEAVPMAWTPDAVLGAAVASLRIRPK